MADGEDCVWVMGLNGECMGFRGVILGKSSLGEKPLGFSLEPLGFFAC